jgi:hypothetical protein
MAAERIQFELRLRHAIRRANIVTATATVTKTIEPVTSPHRSHPRTSIATRRPIPASRLAFWLSITATV